MEMESRGGRPRTGIGRGKGGSAQRSLIIIIIIIAIFIIIINIIVIIKLVIRGKESSTGRLSAGIARSPVEEKNQMKLNYHIAPV